MSPSEDLYEPPSAKLGDPPTSLGPLYSPRQVAGAAFLGSPIAGCWLLASNFRELGLPGARRNSFLGGLVGTVTVLALAFVLPDNIPNAALPVGYTVALHQIAEKLQGPAFRQHLAAGGRKHSSWRVAGIGFGFLLLVVAALFAVLLTLPEGFLSKV